MKRIIWLVFAIAIMAATGIAGPVVTFTLDPLDGILYGLPGTSVGWGFTVSTSSDYVVVTAFGFDDLTPVGDRAGWFTAGVPFTIATALLPFSAPYIEGSSGLQYDIWSTASSGDASQGGIWLTYDAFSDPDATIPIDDLAGVTLYAQLLNGGDVTAAVNVIGGKVAVPIPEPGSVFLIAAGFAALSLSRCRARARRHHRA